MGGTWPTSSSPLYPLPLLIYFLLLLLARVTHLSEHQHEDLSCLNDYMGNVSCVWNCSSQSEKAKHNCTLIGSGLRKERATCEMMSLRQGHCNKGCHFQFKNKVYLMIYTAELEIKCAGRTEKYLKYRFAKHIKLRTPPIPSINHGNLSWSAGPSVPNHMTEFMFERQLKREDESWKVASLQKQKQWKEDLEPLLHRGVRYQARVRVMPDNGGQKNSWEGTWSDWSPILTWTSDVGDPPPTPSPQPHGLPLSHTSIGLLSGALGLAVVMMLYFNRNICCSKLILKNQHVPDPSRYFQPLHSVHGGDFQKWLSPMFGSESFAAAQSCDSISPVEVAPILYTETSQDLGTLVPLQGKSNGAWTGSGQSSCYSNMGYFYSEYQPGLLHIESCPIYFTYPTEADGNVVEADTSGISVTSYERLEQIQQFHFSVPSSINPQGEPLSPDSGFGIEVSEGGNINEENEDVEEEEEHPFTMRLQSLGIPIPIPIQTPLIFPMMPPELESPAKECELLNTTPVPTCSYNLSPADGSLPRSASLVIQPCDSGYMTVKEMQNTYSNKSI